jgi:hypothetical protein
VGQRPDDTGALPTFIPQAGALLADQGHAADWFRNTLIERGFRLAARPEKGGPRRSRISRNPAACALDATVIHWLPYAVAGLAPRSCPGFGRMTPTFALILQWVMPGEDTGSRLRPAGSRAFAMPGGHGQGNAVFRADAARIEHANELGIPELH